MSKVKTRPHYRRPHYRWDDVYIHELVSLEAAREVYKVVIDPATRKIDWQQTQALRGVRAG